ncbi:MAG: hypothetical protein HYX76_02130 [Acidobacteria bacterium]|nr:hypothetical protein [Acidobacteriota bacterium]
MRSWLESTDLVSGILLDRTGDSVRAGSRWGFALRNGETYEADACVTSDWLTFSVRLPSRLCDRPAFAWLEIASHFDGRARLALPGSRHLAARVDLAARDDADPLEKRIDDACAALLDAVGLIEADDASSLGRAVASPSWVTQAGAVISDIVSLAVEAGWQVSQREHRTLVVLPGRRGVHHADVAMVGPGLAIRVPLARELAAWSGVSKDALAVLLLSVCGSVPMVRAWHDREKGQAGLSVGWAVPPSPELLVGGLEAVTVGCDACAPESAALADDLLAERYLVSRGWPPQTCGMGDGMDSEEE